jgi:hypothetical protein
MMDKVKQMLMQICKCKIVVCSQECLKNASANSTSFTKVWIQEWPAFLQKQNKTQRKNKNKRLRMHLKVISWTFLSWTLRKKIKNSSKLSINKSQAIANWAPRTKAN